MGSTPVLKPSEVADILKKLGFEVVRQRGSHQQFRDAKGRCTTVPAHKGRDIAPPLLRQITKDIGMSLRQRQGQKVIHHRPCRQERLGFVIRRRDAWLGACRADAGCSYPAPHP
ncbi:MAG: addiction module toxin, HicA family [Synechococcaceae bacterium WB6_3B_236]|nr:addiction module toxin, HicA family [Synechococcaceae bacterium WB6_3B_236]